LNTKTEPKFRFLIVSSDNYPPFRADTAVLFGQEMTGRGHQIDWLLQSEEDCDRSYMTKWSGGDVWVGRTDNGHSRLSRLRKHIFCIVHQLKLLKLLRNRNYDFIQVRNKFIVALAAAIGARIFKVRFIFWLSFPVPEASMYIFKQGIARYPFFYFIRGHVLSFLMYKVIMPSAQHIFIQSEKMKADVMARGISADKLTPVPMGVSLSEFDQYRKSSGDIPALMSIKQKSVLYLGTLERTRKMDFLIRVHKLVLKEVPDAVLYFVGDGQDEEDRKILERTASQLGISNNIIITGFLPRAEAMEYVKRADVCVSPFCPSPILDSTSPTKLVEYMVMEKAAVVNEHPDQQLVIEKSGGGICVPYDEEAFAEAIIKLLGDPVLASEMGKRGRFYVEQYRDYEKIADFVEDKYYQIVSYASA